ncbi:HK97-gp10 family putative phage morphogenesis protein [Mesorhizobium sp. NZP2298]|uniref:HK97-gp10 family putative phage morphogenesis protein n=1 Tax=Mesorhizobium sp. NZP2298 TaxID=2483403 RepID=UPI001552AACB|nr:HK97-gp10 family putative phage morphogenesis protein [Mesorhizobium sp. NZP2298]QKC99180.1 HK97 gp10 family phage protein [Mesorhizobium sp. NZP2298]
MTILGLASLNKKLKALPKAAEVAISAAMAKGADEMVALMKSLVPVDSGELRDSIAWTWGNAPKGALAIGTVTSTDGKLTITIYAGDSEAFYARWVEFGTKAHIAGGKFAGAQIPAIPAHPFFFVSFRALRKRTKSRITRAINKSAKQVANGGSGP